MIPKKHVDENTHLGIDIITDKVINANIQLLGLKEVTNPTNFDRGMIPTIDGLFSEVIFGVTQEERRKNWGYIDLGCKVLHPFVYQVLCSLQQNISKVCRGESSWTVTEAGDLVEVPDGDMDNTGYEWFYKNFKNIKFKKNKSREHNEKVDMISTFDPNELFISKWLVIPIFFRDVDTQEKPLKIPEINKEYQNILRYSQSIKYETIQFVSNSAKTCIQQALINIQKYFQEIIQKSDGFFKQYVIGKNPDYGVRSVISCPVLTQYDIPEDSPIDMNTTGFPLSEVLQMLFPFVQRWIYNFFMNEFESRGNKIVGNDKVIEYEDVMALYTPDYIKKRIDGWIDSYESRFDLVEVPTSDGKNISYIFHGVPYSGDNDNSNASDIAYRDMTWTDLLYIAAVECAEDKYAWVTRYPLINYLGTFPTKIHVLSTVETEPTKIILFGEEKIYQYYPKIDLSKTTMEVSVSFNETVNMSNTMLDVIGGDYDGDTISAKAMYTQEANQEVMDLLYDPKHFLLTSGQLIAQITNEGNLTLYNMTKD